MSALMKLSSYAKTSLVKSCAVTALASAVFLSGCSTVNRFNPFTGSEEPNDVATQGERISIVAFEEGVTASERLAGQDYYIPAPRAVAAWTLSTGPQGAEIENIAAAADFEIAWSKSVGVGSKGESQVLAQPVSDGQLIYTMDGEARVSAFDAETGRQVWSENLNPDIRRDKNAFGGGLALSGETLFVTSGFRFISAINAKTGATLWTKTLETPVRAAPTVTPKLVLFTDIDNQLMALDQATGEMVWNYQAIVEPARILRASAPVVKDNLVIAPFSSGELIALDITSGTPVWTQVLARTTRTNALSEIRDISGRPLVQNNLVYAASHSGMFAALDLKSGQPRWTIPTDSINAPWGAGDAVFLTTVQGELLSANANSGQVYWIKDLNEGLAKTKKSFFSMGSGKKAANLPVWTGPVLASNRLVMVNSVGEAVTFDAKTGERQKTLKLGDPTYLAPIAVGNKLYIVTNAGKLVAIR